MLSDKKYGLSVNMMATRVMPSLLPQTVNPSLNLEQFMILLEVGFASLVCRAAETASISHTGFAGDAGLHRPATAKQIEVR